MVGLMMTSSKKAYAIPKPTASRAPAPAVGVLLTRMAHLNAVLQKIKRRDKKSFLSDQCKDIEECRVGKSLWRRE